MTEGVGDTDRKTAVRAVLATAAVGGGAGVEGVGDGDEVDVEGFEDEGFEFEDEGFEGEGFGGEEGGGEEAADGDLDLVAETVVVGGGLFTLSEFVGFYDLTAQQAVAVVLKCGSAGDTRPGDARLGAAV
ncbi:MAG: hypothetical protein RNU03_12530 [Candidatus Sedimenticola sp. (ex Thyasira tokunagai)]